MCVCVLRVYVLCEYGVVVSVLCIVCVINLVFLSCVCEYGIFVGVCVKCVGKCECAW